jgi:hypothetical protein
MASSNVGPDESAPLIAIPVGRRGVDRPGGLTALTILCIVLGALGLVSGVWAGVGLAIGRQLQQAFVVPAEDGEGSAAAEIQARMQSAALELNDRYLPLHLVVLAAQLAVCGGLVYGGIQALRLQPGGNTVLKRACLAAVVFELARLVPNLFIQMQLFAIYQEYLPRLMEASASPQGPAAEQFPAVLAGMARAILIFSLVVLGGWTLVKMALYLFTVRYLGRPHVRQLFGGAATTGVTV